MKSRQIELQLLFLPVLILTISAIGFLMKTPVQPYYLWLSILLSFTVMFLFNKKFIGGSTKSLIISFILFIVILSVFFLLSSFFLSTGWDDFAYHEPTILLLAHGWNPFTVWDPNHWAKEVHVYLQFGGLSSDIYGMAGELVSAVFYKAIPVFEGAKIYNLIYIVLILFVGFRFLRKFSSLSKIQVILLLIPLALNPVAADQAWVFYIDGQMASLFTLLILFLLDAIIFNDTLSLFEAGGTFILLANIKLSGIVFGGLIVAALFLYCLIYKRELLAKYFLIFLGSFFIAFTVVGYQPYLVNTIDYFNPFHYVMSPTFKSGLFKWADPSFLAANRFEQFFISLFANNLINFKHFAVDKFVLFPQVYDPRTMAFGFIFGYLFVVSTVLFFFIKNRLFRWIAITILISLFLIDGAWWARIVPQTWLFPLIVLLGVLLSRPSARTKKIISIVMVLLSFNAMAIFLLSTGYEVSRTAETNKSLRQLSQQHAVLVVDKNSSNIAEARILNHAGIPLKTKSQLECKHFIQVSRLRNTKYCLAKDVIAEKNS